MPLEHPQFLSRRARSERGAALMEVLIAMLIVAFGMLGYVGLQAQTSVANLEGYQRSQALILVNDMAQRMALNRANAASYVATNIGVTDPGNCAAAGLTRAQVDLCQWALAIQGASEVVGTTRSGAVLLARGCIRSIVSPLNSADVYYQISLAWQGLQATGASPDPCGRDAFSDEALRRTVSVVVQVGRLVDPAS